MTLPDYPIHAVSSELKTALSDSGKALLEAPPGAGKSTLVPLILAGEPWLKGRIMILLQPRRAAARAISRRIRRLAGAELPTGLITRYDHDVPKGVRLLVMTEGVFLRRLLADPAQRETALVIFDEFHERSLNADLCLALCRQCRYLLNEELKILIMSATLDAGALKSSFSRGGEAVPEIRCDSRLFPVTMEYKPLNEPRLRADELAGIIAREAGYSVDGGDILVFLPGEGIIGRCRDLLKTVLGDNWAVCPLFSRLDRYEQQTALEPDGRGRRKIILSTNIAETSLTIEGVTLVIDSGLRNTVNFHEASGMSRLETVRISEASAVQRMGRAGRRSAGRCLRLWPETERLNAHDEPEVLGCDTAPLLLSLACWGDTDISSYDWVDAPPASRCVTALNALKGMSALDNEERITDHGRLLASLPLSPRMGQLALAGESLLAALLEAGDPFTPPASRALGQDVSLRLEALSRLDAGGSARDLKPGPARQILRDRDRIEKIVRKHQERQSRRDAGLFSVFADRLAMRISPEGASETVYQLVSGRQFRLPPCDRAAAPLWIFILDADGGAKQGRIHLFYSLDSETGLDDRLKSLKTREEILFLEEGRFRVRFREKAGSIVLSERAGSLKELKNAGDAVLNTIAEQGLGVLVVSDREERLLARLRYLHFCDPDRWPDYSEKALITGRREWLASFIPARITADIFRRIDVAAALKSRLSWEMHAVLDREAPEKITLPSGSSRSLEYRADRAVLSARIQQLFGMMVSPMAGGRPVEIELLSPASRPLQITRDLASFWANTYAEVRREMRGRYPKHHWPEDPYSARATDRVRPR